MKLTKNPLQNQKKKKKKKEKRKTIFSKSNSTTRRFWVTFINKNHPQLHLKKTQKIYIAQPKNKQFCIK